MPGNLICDCCNKQIGDYSNAYFSDREKNLDFCSEDCHLAWGISDEFAIQFKSIRLLGSRLDRHWNDTNLHEVINSYRNKNIDGTTAGLVYNLGLEPNEITSQGTTKYDDKTYNLWDRGEIKNVGLDQGWLTDDNIEYILNNHQGIQQTLNRQNQNNHNWTVRTDIANIYDAFFRSRDTNQELDLTNLLQELEINPYRYTIFPLRVNNNHWGMFILENNGGNKQVYYTSSGRGTENEKEQIKPLINQLVNQNATNNIQIIQGAKQNNSWDCGVYLVKYIEELLETGRLELTRSITEQECQSFRSEWKQRIGAEQWCPNNNFGEENIKGDQQPTQSTSVKEHLEMETQTDFTSVEVDDFIREKDELRNERDNLERELTQERQVRDQSRERNQRRLTSDRQVLRDQLSQEMATRIIQNQELRWQRQGGNN